MKSTNGKLGPVAVTLERGQVNALLQTLNCISVADTSNQFAKDAAKLKEKIIRHGRTFTHKETDSVSLYFYENEAANLIRLLSLFLFSAQDIDKDYFPEIGRIHKRGLGNSQSAEQTLSGNPKTRSAETQSDSRSKSPVVYDLRGAYTTGIGSAI